MSQCNVPLQLRHLVKHLELSLILIELPTEHMIFVGEPVAVAISESERAQAERCKDVARSLCGHTFAEEILGKLQAKFEVANIVFSELEISFDLHVDDGYVTGTVQT